MQEMILSISGDETESRYWNPGTKASEDGPMRFRKREKTAIGTVSLREKLLYQQAPKSISFHLRTIKELIRRP